MENISFTTIVISIIAAFKTSHEVAMHTVKSRFYKGSLCTFSNRLRVAKAICAL